MSTKNTTAQETPSTLDELRAAVEAARAENARLKEEKARKAAKATKKAPAAKEPKPEKAEKVAAKKAPAARARKVAKEEAKDEPKAKKARTRALKVVEVPDEEGAHEEGETEAPRRRVGALVVVESPAKAKTIKKYLGSGYVVKASVGHVMDLPKSKMGVDIENGFQPVYEVIEAKKKVVAELKSAAKGVDRVLLATDPDREGEAIAWHVYEQLKRTKVPAQRILFNEITKKAI